MIKNSYKNTLQKLGIESLNEMQEKAVEAIKSDKDVVLLSPTGSGKTLAYLLPLLDLLDNKIENIQVLILAPSRELSLQIESVFKSLASGFKVNCCYGGHPISIEKNNLKHPPAVLIGTPGRIADHMRDGRINTRYIKTLILDEFDKSLEFGFQEDMSNIIRSMRPYKRILTSATKGIEIPGFTGISRAVELNFLSELPSEKLQQKFILSDGKDKLETLFRLICKLGNKPMLVFCNHRESVERISDFLWLHQVPNGVYHGGMEQIDREKALIQFRNGSTYCLVTTDLAARGLDIPEIEYIIHYHLPLTEDAFIHRNGRTARMNASGTMYMILSPGEKNPSYIQEEPVFEELPADINVPELSLWTTIYIAAGKKDKINKIDIVGFLLQQGNLKKEELGRIDVLDFTSYAAVASAKVQEVIKAVRNIAIKKKKVIIEIAK
jgi:ATP-independent RNA helicase DbpA